MFSLKNPTPRMLAFMASAVIAVFVGIISMVPCSLYYAAVFPVSTFVVSFVIFTAALKHFIYRKIKIIYKTIFDFKNTKDTVLKEKLDLKKDILQNTENDVKQWIEEKSDEIVRLKEQEKFRREFLANVSHELRTPIFNVQGYLETLLDGGLNDEHIGKDYLQKALKNISRLNSIISDLEKISHLERGETFMEYSEFEIKPLVQEVFDLLTYSAKKKNIKLGFKKSCTLNATVRADREKIKEVLINLVGNAINYGNPGGKVLVGCYDMENKILVEVSDDGIGIPKEHLPYIFNRFYRVDKNRSRMEGGTGLGLSIVKHIIEAHGQVINVRSTPGQGSTFGFTLERK